MQPVNAIVDSGFRSLFSGKERDAESGNDYMFARYYNSATGRFLSPDWSAKGDDPVPYAKLDNPQTLNLYAYILNNPLSKVDPDGHCSRPDDPDCSKVKVESKVTGNPKVTKQINIGTDKDGNPIPTGKAGVSGEVTHTITNNKWPIVGAVVTEKNNFTRTENGQNTSANLQQRPPDLTLTTDKNGQITDRVADGLDIIGTGKNSNASEIVQHYSSDKTQITVTDTQTLTIGMPGGGTCSVTEQRTLSNGTGGPHYTITPNSQVVTPTRTP